MTTNLQTDIRPGQARNTALDQQMRHIEQALNSLSSAMPPAVRVVTASTSVIGTDEYLFVDASAGAVNIGLPAASIKRRVSIVKTDASGNAVTVVANGTDKINGAGSFAIAAQYTSVSLVSSGGSFWGVF